MTNEEKAEIDAMTLKDMLRLWRFAPAGSPYFTGERGRYFINLMSERRGADPDGWVRASKSLGFEEEGR